MVADTSSTRTTVASTSWATIMPISNGEVSGEVSRIGMTMCLAADDTVGGW